jgi:hypothetical protein
MKPSAAAALAVVVVVVAAAHLVIDPGTDFGKKGLPVLAVCCCRSTSPSMTPGLAS